MGKQTLLIDTIPAAVWGKPSDKVYLYVHGKGGCKEEAESFAAVAEAKGYQVIGFDLWAHGERTNETWPVSIQQAVHEMHTVMKYVQTRWQTVSLYAVSIGAYYSLSAYQNIAFENCLFVSPVVNMEKLIQNMMMWVNVSEKELQDKKEIPTPFGETLSWDYLQYVRAHKTDIWKAPSAVICGGRDNLTETPTMKKFTDTNSIPLTVIEEAEHYLHRTSDLEILQNWVSKHL